MGFQLSQHIRQRPLACPDGLTLFSYTACLRGSPSSGVVVLYVSVDVELLIFVLRFDWLVVSTSMTGRRLVRGSVYFRSFGAGAQFPGTHEMILILILR